MTYQSSTGRRANAAREVLSSASTVRCPHGGRVLPGPERPHAVRVAGAAVLTVAETLAVSGCPWTVNGVPRPCRTVRWADPGPGGVRVGGAAVVLAGAAGQCYGADLAPQGPPTVVPGGRRGAECR
ncbi:hypothetical protein SAMN06297387_110183 [Streptomyces zhaozhouensis]|uniref:Uncharacterized protein n=1 Tax=Streptomyces zhaozhouensis TaxID=1300267 RepID=A0A286DXR0_9ACTN|nr:hypothetical protein [Streptomyces zhaozhouensis]SOD63451.1 hypothetical protein SAMN06297387_110183 [Streptomyces zhaozhouensis]